MLISDFANMLVETIQKMNGEIKPVANEFKEKEMNDQTLYIAAYSWVYEKIVRNRIQENENDKPHPKNKRIFSVEENSILGIENLGLVQKLYNSSLLTETDLDIIMSQIKLLPEEKRSKDELILLILYLLLDADLDTLPGSRMLLYSSDTIN
ncbi:MAG: DUF494 family protein [Ignavibacteriales bacterium]|nr:MAG: DUF494 family protein [Ignavibacteriales bacterium]